MISVKNRFDSKFRITPGCWIWIGTTKKSGMKYGVIKVCGRMLLAHRVSFEIYVRPIAEGMFVLHKCDNPCCVNPDHLFEGTHQDNMDDKVSKNRQARGSGITGNRNSATRERHGRTHLTENDVAEIRRIASTHHHYGRAALAKRFGVSEAAIKAIKSGKNWKPN